MHVLFLNWKDPRHPHAGGAEVMISELAVRLVRNGHHVSWFTKKYPGAPSHEGFHGIHIIRRGGLFTVYLQAWVHYRRLPAKPDVVIEAINTLAWLTPLYVPAAKRAAVVFQLAESVLFYHVPRLIAPLAWWGEKIMYQLYRHTRIISISPSTTNDLVATGISRRHIYPCAVGVNHKNFYPISAKTTFPSFVFVGRLVPMKRVDLCLDGFALVAQRFPDATLYIVGRGPEKKKVQQRIVQHALTTRVFVTDDRLMLRREEDEKNKISRLQRAWALLLLSVKEGWGIAVTEAAACGTPAIVANVSGLRDAVVPESTGILLQSNPTADEVAAAMMRLITNATLRERLSEQAYRQSQTMTWENSYTSFCHALQIESGPVDKSRSTNQKKRTTML